MAHAAGDGHEQPVYGAHCRLVFPILDADGDLVTGATGLDSEVSIDGGTFADCTNEAAELATSSGMYALYLTGAEMTGKVISVIVKSSGKTTPITLYPTRLPVLESGTAQAGAAGTVTLASGASAVNDFYNGLFVLITNNDPSGAQYQLRKIIDYAGSTRVATIESNWGTNPSSASTYDILVPLGVSVHSWAGTRVAEPATVGYPLITVAATGIPVGAFASAAITADAIATDALGALELSAGAAQEIADAILATALAELAQAKPGATPTLSQAIMLLYMAFRNKSTVTSTLLKIFNDAGVVIAKATVSDDGATFTREEAESGP